MNDNTLKKAGAFLAIALFAASNLVAATVVNRGQTITVTLQSEVADAGDAVKDMSTVPTQNAREGLLIFTYDFARHGADALATNTANQFVEMDGPEVPDGTIFLDDVIVEPGVAFTAASLASAVVTIGADGSGTVASPSVSAGSPGTLIVGGITVVQHSRSVAVGNVLHRPFLNFSTVGNSTVLAAGKVTVYCPVILGNAQR
jgi:hypothetical protein